MSNFVVSTVLADDIAPLGLSAGTVMTKFGSPDARVYWNEHSLFHILITFGVNHDLFPYIKTVFPGIGIPIEKTKSLNAKIVIWITMFD